MDNRERILDAATRVYAQHGFRGATTRLIAQAAGVNEVTLFRIFGSKSGLFDALLSAHLHFDAAPELPGAPAEPLRELTDWCRLTLGRMRASRSLLRKMIGEMEERPLAAVSACQGSHCAAEALALYVTRLREHGLADADEREAWTAVSMLMGALIGDAMCREIMPESFPQPEESAPAQYARVFLRAIGNAVEGRDGADTRERRAS